MIFEPLSYIPYPDTFTLTKKSKHEIFAYFDEREDKLIIGKKGINEFIVSNARQKIIEQRKDHLAKDLDWLYQWAVNENQYIDFEEVKPEQKLIS